MHNLQLYTLHWEDFNNEVWPFLGFNPKEIGRLNDKLSIHPKIREWLLVSGAQGMALLVEGHPATSHFVMGQFALVKQQPKAVLNKVLQIRNGQEAVNYFGEWMCGFRTPLLGDSTMINLLKKSYQNACDNNTVGPYIHRLVQRLFSTHNQIRKRTPLHQGKNTLPGLAVDLLESYLELATSRKIAIIGYGERGNEVLRHLKGLPIKEVAIFSDLKCKGSLDEKQIGFKVSNYELEDLRDQLPYFSLIVNTLNGPHPLVTGKLFSASSHKFRLVLDLSFTHGVSQQVGQLPETLLISSTPMRAFHQLRDFQKPPAMRMAKALLAACMDKYHQWEVNYQAMGVIREFKQHLLVNKVERWKSLCQDHESEVEVYPEEHLIHILIQDLLKNSVLKIKSAKTEQEKQAYIALIAQMYLN
ncbi:glutamyl-tRNA reductase [Pleomorphovibrio marinus]|uniref:hypothetical protein n=1 Tax=Pleomorphovibrio marinus TaxID=2164132 RepID=UPI000E0BEB81|nr:hypothetical protein [Pleomorphovibrio marinus]